MTRIFILISLSVIILSIAIPADKSPSIRPKSSVTFAQRIKQGFNMRVWLSNQMTMGLQAWDGGPESTPDGFGLEYPTGSGIEHMYGGGPYIGGIINGARHVDEAYNPEGTSQDELLPELRHIYREHFWRTGVGASARALIEAKPDPLGFSGYYFVHNQIVDRRGCDDDHDGRIDEDDLDGVDNDGDWNVATDDVGGNGLPDSLEASCDGNGFDPSRNPDPAQDNLDGASRDNCRFNADGSHPLKTNPDIYTEKNGIPDHGEPHVDEDYGAVSDNDLYCSAIDTFRTPSVGGHFPMGIKVVQKSYAWEGSFAEGILPFEYYFINVGQKVIQDVYVGFVADVDVGPVSISDYYSHTFACYYDTLRTGYVHNGLDRGSTPLGITVLHTPRALDSLKYIFQWYAGGLRSGPGLNDSAIYSWMSGEAFPSTLIWPCQTPTNPADDRIFYSFGPFATIRPGDTLRVSLALVSGYSLAEGPNNMKENAEKALKLYSRGYVQPTTLPSPSLQVEQGFKKATLRWGTSIGTINPLEIWDDSNKLAESYPDTHWRRINPPCGVGAGECNGHVCVNGKLTGGRIFQGYRLYRSEDPNDPPLASSFTLLKEYVLPGERPGQRTEWDSVFVDTNLVRGKRYWYSITSFGIPDIAIIPIKQSDGSIIYDTLYTENSQSTVGGKDGTVRVDLAFSSSNTLGEVLAVPNPYRVDNDYTYESGGWEGRARSWTENNRLLKFIHLPPKCTIRIFSLSGDVIATLDHDDPVRGELEWNLLSESRRALASGVYVFTVESDLGRQIGKFVLIR